MTLFLIEYHRPTGTLVRLTPYDEADADTAAKDLRRLEADKDPDLEVVILRADSEADIRRTHSRYFESAADIAGRF